MDGNSILSLVIILGVVLFSMVLHELAHGLVAYWLGDDTAKEDGRLTLNPFKHLDPVLSFLIPIMMFISGGPVFGGAKPVPVDSRNLKHGVWGMALVAIAGPLTNLLLALVGFLIGYWTGGIEVVNGAMYYANGVWGMIAAQWVLVNIGFGVFNMIPIPPLDGSRVLYAIAPDGVRDVMSGMEKWGLVVVMLVVVFLPNVIGVILNGATSGILTAFGWLVGLF